MTVARATAVRALIGCGVALAGASQAQVYKWTDASGRVHYGDKKDATGARPQELQLKLPPAPPTPPSPPASSPTPWALQKPPQPVMPEAARQSPPTARSLSGGREDGSDASRCNLARDVLSGAVRHSNGAKTDQYDRDIATADVKRFCR